MLSSARQRGAMWCPAKLGCARQGKGIFRLMQTEFFKRKKPNINLMPLPNKKYGIIYADPPWMEQGGGKVKRGADRHYHLMKTEDIISLDIISICSKNAHLYLWVTNAFLPDGLAVMKAWGFRYITAITWAKNKFGLGQYFRGQTEHCLFGVRGNLPYKIKHGKRQQGTTLLLSPRLKHSRKPPEMRQIIKKVSDRRGLDKIELFARVPDTIDWKGWDAWGYQWDKTL